MGKKVKNSTHSIPFTLITDSEKITSQSGPSQIDKRCLTAMFKFSSNLTTQHHQEKTHANSTMTPLSSHMNITFCKLSLKVYAWFSNQNKKEVFHYLKDVFHPMTFDGAFDLLAVLC